MHHFIFCAQQCGTFLGPWAILIVKLSHVSYSSKLDILGGYSIAFFTPDYLPELHPFPPEKPPNITIKNIVILGGKRVSIREYPRSKEGGREILPRDSPDGPTE